MKASVLLLFLILANAAAAENLLVVERGSSALHFKNPAGVVAASYNLSPAHPGLPVKSGGYFHPFKTPAGLVLTEVAPADHPHHRGIFLGWVEMHGKKDADFWGWGQHAPTKDRIIIPANENTSGFPTTNKWMAEGEVLIWERLDASMKAVTNAHLLTLAYALTPVDDIELARWAFSGFCVRTRKDGQITAYDSDGEVKHANPKHTEPQTDWPDRKWYAYKLEFEDGKTGGVAVINHPANPPTLWHNHRDVRMLNPCIVAPASLKLQKGKTLTLRYRVLAFDGAVPSQLLDRLATKWSRN